MRPFMVSFIVAVAALLACNETQPSAPLDTSEPEPGTIFIASYPPVADVYMDGVLIGKTNISKLEILSGDHEIRFVKDTCELTLSMTFTAGNNPSRVVKICS